MGANENLRIAPTVLAREMRRSASALFDAARCLAEPDRNSREARGRENAQEEGGWWRSRIRGWTGFASRWSGSRSWRRAILACWCSRAPLFGVSRRAFHCVGGLGFPRWLSLWLDAAGDAW